MSFGNELSLELAIAVVLLTTTPFQLDHAKFGMELVGRRHFGKDSTRVVEWGSRQRRQNCADTLNYNAVNMWLCMATRRGTLKLLTQLGSVGLFGSTNHCRLPTA